MNRSTTLFVIYFAGSMIMDKEKHANVSYHQDEKDIMMKINDSKFKKLTELSHDVAEIESNKKSITLNQVSVIGFFVLQYAKQKMLSWYFDCLDYYVDRKDFEYCEKDTDSAYFAISGENLLQVIKPELKSDLMNQIFNSCDDSITPKWFPRECCDKHKKYDRRTSGLFKLEASGTEMIALCSKTYLLKEGEGQFKMSCKGMQKNGADETEQQIFENVSIIIFS